MSNKTTIEIPFRAVLAAIIAFIISFLIIFLMHYKNDFTAIRDAPYTFYHLGEDRPTIEVSPATPVATFFINCPMNNQNHSFDYKNVVMNDVVFGRQLTSVKFSALIEATLAHLFIILIMTGMLAIILYYLKNINFKVTK